MKRRTFLKAVGGSAVGGQAVMSVARAQDAVATQAAGIPQRTLGKSDKKVSVVCFPGLALIHGEQKECTDELHKAFGQGITHFDVAPAYGNGVCETRMGIGLEGIPRDKYFLSCKTKLRDAQGAREELERSLKLLKTDHFDLYQMHCLFEAKEVEEAFGPGGAMETFLKAREEGKIGLIGFSAHTSRSALAAMKQYRFDTVMFPINFVELFTIGFGDAVLKLAQEQDVPVLAIKAMSRGLWPDGVERTRKWWYRSVETEKEVSMAIRYVLSQSPVKTIVPPSWFDLVDKAVIAARNEAPITDEEVAELRKIAADCRSVFQQKEEEVAGTRSRHLLHADNAHEHCPCWHV